MDWLFVFRDPNTQWILLGCMLLGLSSGVLGSFTYLRKQSLIGDALAHAALPGICIAFMLSGTKSIGWFLAGAAVSGMIATAGISWITRSSRIKQDAALALVLSVFFGIGIVLLTMIQHSGAANQSGLDHFLFGQAAAMVVTDVWTMAVLSVLLIGVILLLFKEFKLISFDPGFARGLGMPVVWLEQLLMFLVVIAVVVGIQAVGVVLMAAMLITPAVAARYWTDRLGVMLALAGAFGAASGLSGTLISTTASNLPTGPLSILSATVLFVVSLLFAPRRGLLAKVLTKRNVRKRMKLEPAGQLQLKKGGESL